LKRFPMLSEQDVLRQLNVPTFRHVTKGKIMSFVAMRQQMDPAVAQKALEQIPNFVKSLEQILADYNTTVRQGLTSNDEHMRAYSAIAEANIAALQKELEKSELSFDERCVIMDRMLVVQNQVSEMVERNRKFIHREHLTIGAVVVFCVGAVAAILGANTSIDLSSPKA